MNRMKSEMRFQASFRGVAVFIACCIFMAAGAAVAPTSARAMPENEMVDNFIYYFAEDGDPAKARAAAALSLPGSPRISATMAFRQVVINWDSFSPAAREALSRYVYVAPGENGRRQVFQVSGYNCKEDIGTSTYQDSTHFRVYYAASGNHASTGDYIQSIINIFENVWQKEITEMGFTQPDLENGRYPVYICDLLGPEPQTVGVTYSGSSTSAHGFSSHIELDNDYAEFSYYTEEQITALIEATVAHEFLHAIQFTLIGNYMSLWLAETSAVWVEEEVYPDSNDYVTSYLSNLFNELDQSIDSEEGSDPYGASLLLRHITENELNSQFIPGLFSALRTNCESGSPPSYCNEEVIELDMLDAQLQAQSRSLSMSYRDFNISNYTKNYVDGTHASFPDVPTVAMDVAETKNGSLDHLAAKFYKLTYPGSLGSKKVVLSGDSSTSWEMSLVKELSGGQYSSTSASVSSGAGSIPLSGFGAEYDTAVVVVNNTDKTRNAQSYSITLEDYNPSAVCGDISGDGYVLSDDVLLAARASISAITLTQDQMTRGDIATTGGSPDGYMLSDDLLLIARLSISSITQDDVTCPAE